MPDAAVAAMLLLLEIEITFLGNEEWGNDGDGDDNDLDGNFVVSPSFDCCCWLLPMLNCEKTGC